MASRLNPYISFDGNARQAMEFYQQVFGGTLTDQHVRRVRRRRRAGRRQDHARAARDHSGYTLMGADTRPGMAHNPGDNITVSLSGDDADELRGYWEKLSDGGTVVDAAGEADVGRRVRHVHRPVRRRLDGQHHPAAKLSRRLHCGKSRRRRGGRGVTRICARRAHVHQPGRRRGQHPPDRVGDRVGPCPGLAGLPPRAERSAPATADAASALGGRRGLRQAVRPADRSRSRPRRSRPHGRKADRGGGRRSGPDLAALGHRRVHRPSTGDPPRHIRGDASIRRTLHPPPDPGPSGPAALPRVETTTAVELPLLPEQSP